MITYNNLLHDAYKLVKDTDISIESIKFFLFELCNEKEIDLYLELDNEVDEEIKDKFISGVERIIKGEPIHYILGYTHFFGYKLFVDNNVLIPRYETEELVGLILSTIDENYQNKNITLADIGTGSGALAIALKKEEESMNVYGSDISQKAIAVAERNAEYNDADIKFFIGDMLEPIKENNIKLDILVCNPPYIPSREEVDKSVYDYEPHIALFGGEDGLKYYRIVFENAKYVLKEKAFLFFEIGYNQADSLSKLIDEYFDDVKVEIFKDINGKNRMLKISI